MRRWHKPHRDHHGPHRDCTDSHAPLQDDAHDPSPNPNPNPNPDPNPNANANANPVTPTLTLTLTRRPRAARGAARALRRALRGAPRVRGALLPAHAAGAAAEGRHLLHELILVGASGSTGRAVGPAGVPAAAHSAPDRARARMLRNMMSPTVNPLPELASRRRWRPSIRRVACGLLGDRPTHTQTSRDASSTRHDDIWDPSIRASLTAPARGAQREH